MECSVARRRICTVDFFILQGLLSTKFTFSKEGKGNLKPNGKERSRAFLTSDCSKLLLQHSYTTVLFGERKGG